MYTFQASIQDGRSQIEWLLTVFCCAITTSSLDAGSLERRRVNEGEGLTPYHAGYRDSGNNASMYSPLMWLQWRGGGGIGMEISQSASGSVMAPDRRFHPVAQVFCGQNTAGWRPRNTLQECWYRHRVNLQRFSLKFFHSSPCGTGSLWWSGGEGGRILKPAHDYWAGIEGAVRSHVIIPDRGSAGIAGWIWPYW